MPRVLTTEQLAQLSASKGRIYHLFKLYTDTPVVLTTCYKDIVFGADTYLSGGFLIDMPTWQENLDLEVEKTDITISAVNQALLASFLSAPPYNKKIEIYKIWLDDDGVLVGDPYLKKRGYFNSFELQETQNKRESKIKLSFVNEFIDFQKRNGRQSNVASQQKIFSADTGLRHSEVVINDLHWGKG